MTKGGDETQPEDPEAAKFCLIGAMVRVKGDYERQSRFEELLGFDSDVVLTDWNDEKNRTKRAVLARLKRAIDKERAKLLSGAA
jgi:hypothetical protein